jgi:hypothetical protein
VNRDVRRHPDIHRMRDSADLRSIHRFSDHHRELLTRSDRAGCFYCGQFFAPAEIEEWIDGLQVETGDTADGVTALCPRCCIDAVLPSAAPMRLDAPLLDEMHQFWFEKGITVR